MEVKTIERSGFTAVLQTDPDPINPRKDYDNFGHMVCWHRRYNLGDEQPKMNFSEWRRLLASGIVENDVDDDAVAAKIINENTIMLPLFLYDHSGITMNTTGFSCQWDSGQVGVIYATKDDVIKEYGEWNPENIEKARKLMVGEVETYDQLLTGDVYGYEITDKSGEVVDSCWSIFGDKWANEEMEMALNAAVADEQARREESLVLQE